MTHITTIGQKIWADAVIKSGIFLYNDSEHIHLLGIEIIKAIDDFYEEMKKDLITIEEHYFKELDRYR
jgi:hypothetical protein